jgi:hypothetical protein
MTAPSPRAIETAMSIAHSMLAGLEADHVDTDEDELRILLREADADIEALVVRLLRTAAAAEDDAEAISRRIEALVERRERHNRRRLACRNTVMAILQALPQVFPGGRVRCAEFTASVANGRQHPRVVCERLLPEDCWRVTRSHDMTAIRERLKSGPVPGVTLSNAEPVLMVRGR